ncbi:unnamed protein product [Boreogadus saida]
MRGLRTVTLAQLLSILLLATLVSRSWSAPKSSFQRRNWTPQAMLYLKGTQGRRFISEDGKEGDVYDTLHLESQGGLSPEKQNVDQAAALLLSFLQTLKDQANENANQLSFQDLPVWKREYF